MPTAAANLRPQLTTFFTSPLYLLSGASPIPSKYGHKLYTWYLGHSLAIIPINPRNPPPQIHPAQPPSHPTCPSLSAVPPELVANAGGWGNVSLSIVTPPKVTRETLKEARGLGVRRVWMQPGAWDDACVEEGKSGGWEWECFVYGGEGEGEMRPGMEEGWCVLVHGEEGLREAKRRAGEKGKL
ncbi:CoA binding domain-containing protein [Tirmania nivea]|nr:CoA binding domain-containing protein [Tirmania nivea]